MQPTFTPRILLAALLILPSLPVFAQVGDPTIRTDHPHYPGEGAFQTVEDCVAFAAGDRDQPQDRAIALFNWLLTHQFHLYSPQEWLVPGKTPGANRDDSEMIVYDANRGRFSYGYGLCGTVHSWNEPYWRAMGMNARRRAFPGHVNSEVHYDNAWHAFDTDMAGLVFRRDGVVAGYDDIIADPSIVKPNDRGIPCYPFAWPGDFQGMQQGWRQVAQGGKWYALYNSGYAALPGVVHVRRGETFTRHFDRDHFGGPGKRRFWHVQEGGPFRNWTFVNMGDPRHDGAQSNSRGNASYCNAVFEYEPDLAGQAWRDASVAASANLAHAAASPHLRSRDDQPAHVTFTHFSPYVICGDPVDDKDPMTGRATDGLVVTGRAGGGAVAIELSIDSGQSWQSLGRVEGEFTRDLTEQVKGRYGWQLRFGVTRDAGLDRLRFATTCQTSQAIYPRLTPDGCRVTYRAASRAVVPVQPDFGRDEQSIAAHEVVSMRSDNLRYTPRSTTQRTAYTTTNNKPGVVVFRVKAPRPDRPLVHVAAAANYRVRSPQPDGCDFRLDISTDGGRTWKPMGKAHNAPDNEFSSGWVYGQADVADAPATEAFVRVHLHAGGYTTGLIHFEAFGLHQTVAPTAATITYAWDEAGQTRTHTQSIAAGQAEQTFTIPTGPSIRDRYIRIAAP